MARGRPGSPKKKKSKAKSPKPRAETIPAATDPIDAATRDAAEEAGFDRVEKALEEAAYEALAEAHERSEATWQKARQHEQERERARTIGINGKSEPPRTVGEIFVARLRELGSISEAFASKLRNLSPEEALEACAREGLPRAVLLDILRSVGGGRSNLPEGSYFEILGVSPEASLEEIRFAFERARFAAQQFTDARVRERRTVLIEEAFRVLSVQELRDRHRLALADPRPPS